MSKKLCLLISFVLVLTLSSTSSAWESIDDFNYNLSFEYDACGVQMRCHGDGDLVDVLAWNDNEVNWANPEIDCANSLGTPGCLCKDDPATDGMIKLTMGQWAQDSNLIVWQTLDPAINGNTIIQVSYEYRVYFDTFKWGENLSLDAYLYYGYIPDNNSLDPDVNVITSISVSTGTTYQTFELSFIAEGGQPYIGEPLGIRFLEQGEGWYWIDNVRVQFQPLAKAREPEPADEAEDVPIDVNLSWIPGLWPVGDVNGHEVYFGTSWAEVNDANTSSDPNIYRGTGVGVVSGPDVNNRYSYDVLETLELGKTYYWRIDEVNEDWVSGPVPPVNDRWKGDVWSFRTTGFAYNVYPADGAEDIPSLNLTLYWEAGTGAGGHDVYFGSNEAAVEDATTATTGIYRGPTQPLSDVNYLVEPLDVGETYYWRIDEVNTATVKGDVWRFTTGTFILVDSFEPYRYVTTGDLTAVWVVDRVAIAKNDAQLSLYFDTTDSNKVYSGDQSMEFAYRCYQALAGVQVGSYAAADMPTEVGTDWTVAGVKALMVNFYGDPCNGIEPTPYDITQDQMWVSLEDSGTNEGVVRLPDMNEVKEASWHTWNIDLKDPNFSAVDMNNVARIYIGFGGAKVGQTGTGAGYKTGNHDSVWFDDIRLYPPRCMPAETGIDVLHSLGDITEDCNTDYLDLDIMAGDWAITDKMAQPVLPADLGLVRYAFDEGTGTFVENDGEFGSAYNLTIGDSFEWDVSGNFTGNLVSDPNNTPTWVNDPCRGWCLYFDGEEGQGRPGEDPTMLGGDYLLIPPLNLNLDTVTITAWVYPQPTFGEGDEMMGPYTGIVMTRTHYGGWGIDGNTTAGLSYGDDRGYDGSMGYVWNDNDSDTWSFETGIYIEPLEWNFLTLTIEPSQAVCYRVSQSGTLESATNAIPHDAEEFDFYTGIATDWNGMDRFFKGLMSDVRIYGRVLTIDEIMGLGGMSGQYLPNTSVANISPKDPNDSEDPNLGSGAVDPNNLDIVNFRDYSIMAEHWLEEHLWP